MEENQSEQMVFKGHLASPTNHFLEGLMLFLPILPFLFGNLFWVVIELKGTMHS